MLTQASPESKRSGQFGAVNFPSVSVQVLHPSDSVPTSNKLHTLHTQALKESSLLDFKSYKLLCFASWELPIPDSKSTVLYIAERAGKHLGFGSVSSRAAIEQGWKLLWFVQLSLSE